MATLCAFSLPSPAPKYLPTTGINDGSPERNSAHLDTYSPQAHLSVLLPPNLPEPTVSAPGNGPHPPTTTALPTPVEGDPTGQAAPQSQKAVPVSTGKDVTALARTPLHDSACVLTPLSFLPKTAKPLPPSLSSVHHIGDIASERPDVALGTGQVVQCPCSNSVNMKAKTLEKISTSQPQTSLFERAFDLVLSAPREDYSTTARRRLQKVLDQDPLKWPPKNLAHENAEYQTALEPTKREIRKGFDLDLVESFVDSTTEYWEPFNQRVGDEKNILFSLKEAAFEKLALRQDIEKRVIQLRMGLKYRSRAGLSIQGGKEGIIVFDDTQARLDEEIAAIHAEWESRLINLHKLIERAFWPEYHRTEFEEAMKAEKQRLDAQKEEYTRLMAMMGWESIPYREKPEPRPPEAVYVPEWFTTVESRRIIKFRTHGPRERYNELLGFIAYLQRRMEEDKANTNTPLPVVNFVKRWHEKNPLWPYPNWQASGGWWVCRTGPDASPAEESCRQCDPKRDTTSTSQPTAPKMASERYKEIMDQIERAMGLDRERDKMEFKARMAMQQREASNGTGLSHRNRYDEGYGSR